MSEVYGVIGMHRQEAATRLLLLLSLHRDSSFVSYLSCNNSEIRSCQKAMFANTMSEHTDVRYVCVSGLRLGD
jgi:hypothetical protein